MDPARLVSQARRLLIVGIGGGGDVAGALVFAEAAALLGTPSVIGGLTWERRVVDPIPGPRQLGEARGVRPLHGAVGLCGPAVTGPGEFRFCESAMAEFLGTDTLLVDPNPGPQAVAAGLDAAADELFCDLVVLLDVGGDALAHGDEAGLASPLADAILLASGAYLATPSLGVVFGAGCDGELTPEEVAERLEGVGAVDLPVPPAALDRAEAALALVVTEASAMAMRCARGETGEVPIRGGRRTVRLTATGGRMACFDVEAALAGPARLAAAVVDARDLEHGHELLTARGIRTELAYEREHAPSAPDDDT